MAIVYTPAPTGRAGTAETSSSTRTGGVYEVGRASGAGVGADVTLGRAVPVELGGAGAGRRVASSDAQRRRRRARARSVRRTPSTSPGANSAPAPCTTSSSAEPVGRDRRHSARHRLDRREPEALVQRREAERVGAAVERVEHRPRLRADRPARTVDRGRVTSPQPRGPTTTSVRSGRSRRSRSTRAHDRGDVLARLDGADGEHVRAAARRRARRRGRSRRDRAAPADRRRTARPRCGRVRTLALELAAGELRRHDDEAGVAAREREARACGS